jgi:hypothetical protein
MKQEKEMTTNTDPLYCAMCDQTFQTPEEMQEHKRAFHPQERMSMEEERMSDEGGVRSGSEQQYPRSESNPNYDKNQEMPKNPSAERKQPGSEQKRSEQQQREPGQKRAAS